MAATSKERNIITNKLVLEKTGRTMDDWFLVFDKKGAKKMSHPEIFKLAGSLEGLHPLGEWNQNLLTTSYEWNRGLKARGQKENGFEISISKTMEVPIQILYESFLSAPVRKKWLKEKIEIRTSTENKSARIIWEDGATSLSVDFYTKAKNKSQVVVQHLKIKGPKEAASRKIFWTGKLEELKSLLEKN